MLIENRFPLILVSGSGSGAGKTFFANKFTNSKVIALADGIRQYLKDVDPSIDWFNKTQSFKDKILPKYEMTPRDIFLKVSLEKIRACGPDYWCSIIYDDIINHIDSRPVILDDVRKIVERDYFVNSFKNVIHFHIVNIKSKAEPFDNEVLKILSDYRLEWNENET